MSDKLTKPEPTVIATTEGGGEIGALLAAAVDKNIGVEALEKLTALYERMEDRRAVAAFNAAFAAFKADCPQIKKTATAKIVGRGGSAFSYSYAPLDEVCRVIGPHLDAHGFAYSWDSVLDGQLLTVTCTLHHSAGHSRSSSFTCPTETKAGMSDRQKVASSLSYSKRQSITSVLGLSTTEHDTDAVQHETISPSQVADLEALVEEVGADRVRFLKFCGVSAMESITLQGYERAVKALEAKRGQ